MRALLGLSVFLAVSNAASQGQGQSPPLPSQPGDLGRVEVRGERDNDTEERRQSTTTKIVIGREELDRQGDSTIGEIIKRLPGVTIGGSPGRRGAIRMRGLGGGYTQILLDGERVPPGFSIDQITPEQIERIEILRAPTAETGARAIAGTINIVLREGRKNASDDLKLSLSEENGRTAKQANWVHHIKSPAWNGTLTLSASSSDRVDEAMTSIESTSFADRDRFSTSLVQRNGVHINARMQKRISPGENLTLMPFLVYSDNGNQGSLRVRSDAGMFDSAQTQSQSRFVMGRVNGQYAKAWSGESRIEARFGVGRSRYDYDLTRFGAAQTLSDTGSPLLRNGSQLQDFVDDSGSLNVKWFYAFAGGHQLTSGLELEGVQRDERNNAEMSDEGGNLDASTRRWAIYSQDEFQINTNWGAYAGLRYENILTKGTVFGVLKHNESSVWTPLLHAVYKPDPKKRDQIRASLTRSYKTPSTYQLVARYVPSIGENSWTQADRTGNPDLRPELATGVEIAFERYLPEGGVLSANIFWRDIKDLVRYTTNFNGTRYVSAPNNVGTAIAKGIELEAKFRLNQWVETAPALEIRSNMSFFRSRVHDVPGPDNRLDQQPSLTANLGADYRLRSMPLTLGGNFNFNPGYDTRRSEQQWAYQGSKRVLDAYAVWRFSASTSLRLGVSNWLARDYLTGSTFVNGSHVERSLTTDRNWKNVQFRLEMKI